MQFNENDILEEVSKISIKFLLEEPFYGHFFTSLVKHVTDTVDTLAVGSHNRLVTLYVNAKFWTEVLNTTDYKQGVIKHEILHIVFKHIFRYKQFANKEIFNVAADLIVNQCIKRTQLPDGGVFLECFPELNLKSEETLNYYYDHLMQLYKQCRDGNNGDNKAEKESESWKNLKGFLKDEDQNQRKHKFWDTWERMTNAEKELAEQSINQALENTLRRIKQKDWGNLPSGLQTYLKDFEASLVPKVNWRRILKIFATSSSKTYIKNTIRRPSKRYGTTPGTKIKKRNRLLVAIDTSGSISIEELKEFFSEIHHIWRQNAEILIVECDTDIQQKSLYKGKVPQGIKGGGGTAFHAPIIFANEEYHPDAIIYFTDGHGPNPEVKSRVPIMWLLSQNGAEEEALKDFQGRVLKMN